MPALNLPLGATVSIQEARRPAPVTLIGRTVRLEPLDAAAHGESLFSTTHGPGNEHVWTYLADGPYESHGQFEAALARKATATDAVFLAIVDRVTERALGYASYMRIDPPNRVVEVGNVLFSPPLQGTTVATEAMYLMARHVFEALDYRRYEWKCNDLNAPSKRAAVRFGFTFEGVFRQHMIIKGRNRDTAWYSMLDTEWPIVRAGFERWLDPGNFGDDARQRVRLQDCR